MDLTPPPCNHPDCVVTLVPRTCMARRGERTVTTEGHGWRCSRCADADTGQPPLDFVDAQLQQANEAALARVWREKYGEELPRVLAGNAAWRAEVVPSPPPESPDAAKARRAKRLTRHPRMRLAGERPSWSDLLERVFRVDGFACPGCGGALTLRCVVVNPPATRRILDGLRRATGPPGLDAAGDDRTA